MSTSALLIPTASPRRRRRSLKLAAVLASLGLLIAACGGDDDSGQPSPAPEAPDVTEGGDDPDVDTDDGGDGDTPDDTDATPAPTEDHDPVIVAMATEIDTMDGQAVSDGSHLIVFGNIYEGLTGRTDDGELIPLLAESWEAVGEDVWRFTLRDGVTFHNGEPFDAEAVVHSITRISDENYITQATSYIRGIESAELVDDLTVDIVTDGLLPTLPLQLVNVFMVPPGASDSLTEQAIGTGPYQLESWDRGRQVTITAYEDYWGEAPQVREAIMRTIPDSQAALAALQAGEIDVVLDIFPEQTALVPKVATVGGERFSNIQLNAIGHPALEDARVRLALQHAIDKETLAEAIYGGYARPTQGHQHMSEGMIGFNPDVEPYAYDPELAMALLAEAGYEDGFSLTLNGAIGRFLKGSETVEYIASQWSDVGIDVDIRLWEWNTYTEVGRIPGDEPDALDTRYNWNRNDWRDAGRWYQHVVCGGSSSKYCNETVTEAFDAANDTLDPDERTAHYQRGVAALQEDPSHIMLLQHDVIHATSDRITWTPRPDEWVLINSMQLG